MSANTAELTLIVQAKNLAEAELAKVRTSLGKMTVTAKQVANDMIVAFKDVGHRIGRQLGNLATDILSGGDITNNLVFMGATMAGAIVEGLTAHLIPQILARVAATEFFAPIVASFAAGGVTAGTAFDAAVVIGIAALPFIILAAAVAALVYLIQNPEARQKAKEVALMIIGRIGDGLRALPGLLWNIFLGAMRFAVDAVVKGVRRIIEWVLSIPKQAGDLVRSLPDLIRRGLNAVLDVARRIVGVIIDVILAIPRAVAKAIGALGDLGKVKVDPGHSKWGGNVPGHAEGGWIGLHGRELGVFGEKGPEYVVPNHKLEQMKASPGVTLVGVTEKQIMDMIDRGLYFKLQRAAPTQLRS